MSWTDGRVALLTKLWASGLSASQVAAELGGGAEP
jgi:GcrA cell cycle regulator